MRIADGQSAVTIDRIRAWLAFAPLLSGDFYFRDLELDEAVGTVTLDPPGAEAAPPAGAASAPGLSPGRELVVDRVAFNGGDLSVRRADGSALLRVQSMELTLFVEGRDRYRLDGDLRVNGRPLTVNAQAGAKGADGVRTLLLSASIPGAQTNVTLSGRVSLPGRSFSGEVGVKAEQGLALAREVGLQLSARAALARPFSLTAKMSADEDGLALSGLTFDAGGAVAKGTAAWRRSQAPQLAIQLDFAPFALDAWRAATTPASSSAAAGTLPQLLPSPPARPSARSSLTADIALTFPALSFRGEGLRDGHIAATLANGELTISDFSITLPGTTRVKAFGLVALAESEPSVDGIISMQTFDARSLLTWLGADVSGVPPGRLASASLQGAVQGSLKFLEVNDLEGALDTARVAGRISYAPRARPFVGLDLRLENVNVDGYRAAAPSARPAPAVQPPAKPEVYGVTPSGSGYAFLENLDAEVHVRVDGVTAGGLPGGRIGLDLGLKNGMLDIRTASFEKIAGTTVWVSGSVGGFGTGLKFENLQFDVAGDDIARLMSLARVELDPALASLGSASLTGTLNGGAMQADLSANLKAAGLTARATGQLMEIEKAPRFIGKLEAGHPRFSDLMRAARSWPDGARDPGPLALEARIAQEPGKTAITDLRVTVGRDRLAGAVEVAPAEGRPHVTAKFSDVFLDLDRLLPPGPAQPARPAAAAAGVPAAPPSPWSDAGVRWSFLKGWSGEITIAGPAFTARGISLQDFSGRVIVADDAAELADWQGRIFGAPGDLSFHLAATPVPAVSGQLVVKGADFRALVAGFNGGRTNLKSGGAADLTLSFSTRGNSAAEFAAALSGGGSLRVTASDSGGGLTAGLLGPLNAAAQLDVGTPGKPAPITFETRLVAAEGIVRLEGAATSSRSHAGRFSGTINVTRRQVDIAGILVPRKAGEDHLPISIRGPMDRPTIRLLPPPRG